MELKVRKYRWDNEPAVIGSRFTFSKFDCAAIGPLFSAAQQAMENALKHVTLHDVIFIIFQDV